MQTLQDNKNTTSREETFQTNPLPISLSTSGIVTHNLLSIDYKLKSTSSPNQHDLTA